MCGIVGYIGQPVKVDYLIDILKRLEYRGYDSAGCAFFGDGMHTLKATGRISNLSELVNSNYTTTRAILHTRWATHGGPSVLNAHPHGDCTARIAVVHNGIIENFKTLKTLLESEGHKFVSETDSEVISHLIEKFYTGGLEEAVKLSIPYLEGAYAIVAMHKDEDVIVAAKNGSPLVVGYGNGKTTIASDKMALIGVSDYGISLEDGEIVILRETGFNIINKNHIQKERVSEVLSTKIEDISKNGYKHFMLKEIFEQPESLERAIAGRLKDFESKISITTDFHKVDKIILLGCGTSWHSALIGKYMIEQLTDMHVEVDYASEFNYRSPIINNRCLVVAISQSGETADIIESINLAVRKGAQTLGIVNVAGSRVSRGVDSGIFTHAGAEIGVASTKAFVNQVACLVLLAMHINTEINHCVSYGVADELRALPDKISKILKLSDQIRDIANKFIASKGILYMGRGINYPVALEGALKMKEISYIHASGYPCGEMKHGPLALVSDKTPSIFIATKSSVYNKVLNGIQEVRARKGHVIVIANESDQGIESISDYVIRVPETIPLLSPILNVVPLQLLSYHMADIKGIDCDFPHFLAKSVTVE